MPGPSLAASTSASLPERTGVVASAADAPLATVFADHSLLPLVLAASS
jgi:hypothetical protein